MECHTLDIHINRPVHQLHRILHECLVLRMPCSGWIYRHVVKLRQCGKVVINDRFIAVAPYDCGLQVVGHDSQRGASEEVKGVLASRDQVLLLLRPDGLAVGIMAAGEDGNEYLHAAHLIGCFVHDFKLVAGIVDVHLVASQVFHVAYGARLTLVGTDGQLELGVLISIRMLLLVLLMQ